MSHLCLMKIAGFNFYKCSLSFWSPKYQGRRTLDWHPHYCLHCSLLLQVQCEIKMWIKLITQISPKFTVQAVP